jgi:hypothetical protein
LLNRNASANHRVLFKLVGTKSNKAAIGTESKRRRDRWPNSAKLRGGASYLSQNDLRLHFGLGASDKMNEVDIRWPQGETETLYDVPADFIYTIIESKGIQQKTPLPVLSQR